MNKKENKKTSYFRISVALSCVGMPLTALLIIFLRKYRVYELESEFGRSITVSLFIAIVILPLLYCVFELFYNKAISPLLYKFLYRRHQRRIEKHGLKKVLREQRINKAISSFMIGFIFLLGCSINLFLWSILGVGNLLAPKFDEVPVVLFMVIIAILILLISFLCSAICVRFFIKKKGKTRALKYAVQLKKKPGLLGNLWLKTCGFNRQDIQIYLEKH